MAGSWQGAGARQQPIAGICLGYPTGIREQAEGHQQPADRVTGPAAGQHRPDRGRAHCRQDGGEHAAAKRGQVGPAGLAQQAVLPPIHAEDADGQRPQHPRQHGRPPALPRRPATATYRHDPRRIEALRLQAPSQISSLRRQCGRIPSRERYGQTTSDQQAANTQQPDSRSRYATTANAKVRGAIEVLRLVTRCRCLRSHG
jgi:hypothetical protein